MHKRTERTFFPKRGELARGRGYFANSGSRMQISDKFIGESPPPLDAGSSGELLLQLAQQPALGEREALQRLAQRRVGNMVGNTV